MRSGDDRARKREQSTDTDQDPASDQRAGL
jgi:hypothetical protein